MSVCEHNRSQLLLTSRTEGFGHRFTVLMFALDLAEQTGRTTLLLDDDYWNETHPYRGSYNFMWSVVPLLNRDRAPLLPIASYGIIGADGRALIDHIVAQYSCGQRFVVRMNGLFGHVPGAFHRGLEAMHRLPGFRSWSPPLEHSSPPPTAIARWHIRVADRGGIGWSVLPRDSALYIKGMVDRGLRTRGVRHEVIASNAKAVREHYPWLEEHGWVVEDHPSANNEADLRRLTTADVLVSTGSSFALAAAALAATGAQLHLFMPPKEVYRLPHADVANASSSRDDGEALSSTALRENGHWRTYFSPRNTVPITVEGQMLEPVAMYRAKLDWMLRAVDAGRRADEALASMFHMPW